MHLLQKPPGLLVKSVAAEHCVLATYSAVFLQGYDECCNESTTHTGNVVVENKNVDQKSLPIAGQVLKEHNYALDISEVSSAARCKPVEVCQHCVNHHKATQSLGAY